jgi:hypothetical protein
MGKRRRGKSKGHGPATPAPAADEPPRYLLGRSWLAPLLAFVGLLALYVATLAPSITGGDSGELTAAALSGGVPHPPGFPLFALLARLFAALPLGHSAAWRVNLLSATSTAVAAAVLCAVVQLWTRLAAAGLLAAVLFGTNSVVWRNATAVEVFGLNAAFVAIAFFLWLSIERTAAQGTERTRLRRLVFTLLFACGLAMCNHHTFVFVGTPLALRSLWVARRHLGGSGVALALALGLAGLLPYGYLWLASRSQAAVSWGDQTTLDGLIGHILRRDYGTFSMGQASKSGRGAFAEGGTFLPTLWQMLGHAFPRFLWIGPLLAGLGFYGAFKDRRQRALAYVLAVTLGGYLLVFAWLSNLKTNQDLYVTVLARFCIQSDLLLAIAAGVGFAWLVRTLRPRVAFFEQRLAWAPAVALLLFGAGVAAHAGECNQRGNRVFADFVTVAFASLPPNSIVITMGDHLTGSVFYFREIEKRRPDIIHLDRELLGFAWYGERKHKLYPDLHLPAGVYGRRGWKIKSLLDANPGRPLIVIDRLETWDESWKDGYKLSTNGLVHPLVPAREFPSFAQWQARDRQAMGNYDVVPALRHRSGTWEEMLGELVLTTQSGRAHLSLVYSTDAGNAPAPARYSIALLEDIVAKAGGDPDLNIRGYPGLPPLLVGPNVYKDLGIGYEILSKSDPAYLPRIAIAFEKFLERALPTDGDIAAARRYVEQHRRPPTRRPR